MKDNNLIKNIEIFKNRRLDESINIQNLQTDEYNDIFVDGKK